MLSRRPRGDSSSAQEDGVVAVAAPPLRSCFAGLPKSVAIAYLVLFLAAALLYSTWFGGLPTLALDSPGYMRLGHDLARLKIDGPGIRGPGYPVVLILTGATEGPTHRLFFASLAMQFASIWLVAAVLWQAGVRPFLLFLFGLYFLLPHSMRYVFQMVSETTTQFALVLGVSALCLWLSRRRASWLVAASFALAYAGLVRPSHQLLALALAFVLPFVPLFGARSGPGRRELLAAAALLLVGSGVLIGGYSWLNYRSSGYFGVTSFLGFTLSTRTARVLERLPDEDAEIRDALIAARDAYLTRPNEDHTGFNYFFAESLASRLAEQTGLSQIELSKRLSRLFLGLIVREPMNYLRDVLSAVGVYWMPEVSPNPKLGGGPTRAVTALLQLLFVGAFFVQLIVVAGIALLEFTRMLRRRFVRVVPVAGERMVACAAYLLSFAATAYTFAISCLFSYGPERLRAPVEMSMAAMTLLGIEMWVRWSREIEVPPS